MKASQAKQKLDVLRKGNTGVFTSRGAIVKSSVWQAVKQLSVLAR